MDSPKTKRIGDYIRTTKTAQRRSNQKWRTILKYLCLTPLILLPFLPFHSLFEKEKPVEVIIPDTDATVKEIPEVDTAYLSFMEDIPPFDFSTMEIEQHEGCTDSLVYPGGASGPTISCGLDLGNAGLKTVKAVLEYSVPDSIYNILIQATKVRGENSPSWIRRNQVHLGAKTATKICNRLKVYIWRLLTSKYPNLHDAPGPVKTAMLDIAFQAGVGSKRMDGFGRVIARKDWNTLGQMIEVSYSDFEGGKYHSIHRRRENHGKQIQFLYNPPEKYVIDYD